MIDTAVDIVLRNTPDTNTGSGWFDLLELELAHKLGLRDIRYSFRELCYCALKMNNDTFNTRQEYITALWQAFYEEWDETPETWAKYFLRTKIRNA